MGGVTQSGMGTLTLTANNAYTGPTLISSGALSLANSGSLSGTRNVTVSSGSTLLLGAANQINTNAALTLAGGTLSMAASATRAPVETFATLTLTANSSIDFGNLTGNSSLTFGAITGLSTYKLTVFDWNGSSASGVNSTTGGAGQLTHLFDTSLLTADQLANISFYSGSTTSSGFLGIGGFAGNEIVPVPEPGVWVSVLLLLACVLCRDLVRGAVRRRLPCRIEQSRRSRH
jgi:autotransporter-associated beta strand protein